MVPTNSTASVVAAIGTMPTTPGQDQRHGADQQSPGGQGERRQAVALLGRHHEVRRGADHRAERPEHADQADVGTGEQVEDQHQAGQGDHGTGDGEPAGARPCRSQSQVITATGAVYSMSSATPTCMCSTA